MKLLGYHGQFVEINLTNQGVHKEQLPESVMRQFIGGSGLGAFLLSQRVDPACDPLSAENVLVFSSAPFNNTVIPTSGRHQITAKSPLTGTFGEADTGGHWGTAFHRAGFDALVIKGRAERPVILVVGDDEVAIKEAHELWGLDTFATTDRLTAIYGSKAQVACIGPAGERMVKLASILHDGRHARAAGRGGLGAVMGSKNLKAIVVLSEASRRPAIFDEESLRVSARSAARSIAEKARGMGQFGTIGSLPGAEQLGDLPIKNWSQGRFADGSSLISGQRLAESGRLKKRFFCSGCVIGCGRTVELSDGQLGGGPEYETAAMFGSNCLVDDLEIVIRANELANRYGIDTISSGSVVAFTMEAYEKGLITAEDLDGIVPEWGKGQVILEIITKIGLAEGAGALLGNGVRHLAKVWGADEFAIHSKGLELPAHDPRAFNSLGLSYATSNRGACHLHGMTYAFEKSLTLPELGFPDVQDRFGLRRKAELVVASQNLMGLFDSLKLCKFALFGGAQATTALEWLNLVTGWGMDIDEFLLAGERIFTLKRQFNVGAGITNRDDSLPKRIRFSPRGEGGAAENLPPDLDTLLQEYYSLRGWDSEGRPSKQKLSQLDLL